MLRRKGRFRISKAAAVGKKKVYRKARAIEPKCLQAPAAEAFSLRTKDSEKLCHQTEEDGREASTQLRDSGVLPSASVMLPRDLTEMSLVLATRSPPHYAMSGVTR